MYIKGNIIEILVYICYQFFVSCRVFFLVEDDNKPVSLTITPCASAVESMVTYKSISNPRDYEGICYKE